MEYESDLMLNTISSVRLTIPKDTHGEIFRKELIDIIMNDTRKIIFIQAGAGYGKTTLLSQIARVSEHSVWYSLDGENDLFMFINALCDAIKQVFPEYSFVSTEYLPFMDSNNFISILVNAMIYNIEKISIPFLLVLDDLHTITNTQIKELIANLIRLAPDNIRFFLGSREILLSQLIPLSIRGNILEIQQNELTFTTKEVSDILGFQDDDIYQITEGWPLAIRCFRVLLENGVSPVDVPTQGKEALYSYLIYECISQMPSKVVDFLTVSAYFDELDPLMLDSVLGEKNSKLMLENLVSRNLFTMKTISGYYRYHALFKKCLLETTCTQSPDTLWQKAANYYNDNSDYRKAAEYAIRLDDKELLQNIILTNYRALVRSGNYSELNQWFQALGEDYPSSKPELLLAKGTYFSYIGNFIEAQRTLDEVIPLLSKNNQEFYLEAMVHKARVLRNTDSFEESNALLDTVITDLVHVSAETTYDIVIEKLYNLCWNSQIEEAYSLVNKMIELCARDGNIKVKSWYERYLSAIYFFAGRMKETIYYYEKSLELSVEEREYLDIHDIDIYAAKAYQMIGDRIRSLSILGDVLQKIRSHGNYEELWSSYLFAAEIEFQNAAIDRTNGQNVSYETTMKYFTLANEYAPLYRKTELQMQWAKMQCLTYSLMFTAEVKETILKQIYENFDQCSAYLKCIVMSRLMGFFGAVKDFKNAVKCAQTCIDIGEQAGMLLHPTVAYGILARASINGISGLDANYYIQRYLKLCDINGVYEYFRARNDYDPVIQYALDNRIEPEITNKIIEFCGYKKKKAYIKTFGGFTLFTSDSMKHVVKMRTKKERELFAFILEAGDQGVSKEQIFNAIWAESDSENIKRLIGVNLSQIKKDLESIGIENAILCNKKRYRICRDELICDFEVFEYLSAKIDSDAPFEQVEKLLSIYTGEYLSDFEAHWAIPKRLKFKKMYADVSLLFKNT